MYSQIAEPFAGKKIRGIFFDLGSTLWERIDEPLVEQSLEREASQRAIDVLRVHNSNLAAEEAARLLEQFRVLLRSRVHAYLEANNPDYEPDYVALTSETLQQIGILDQDRQIAREMHEALRVPIDQSRELFKGVHTTLEGLHERGYVLGVVTNRAYGGPAFLESMRVMGLLAYFDQRYLAVSADLKVRKPHPDIFYYALRGLKLAPEETVMVGDNFLADVMGAKALGMGAIWRPKKTLLKKARKHSAHGGNELDQETLVAYVVAKNQQKYQHTSGPLAQPDSTIEHIAELLDIFPQRNV